MKIFCEQPEWYVIQSLFIALSLMSSNAFAQAIASSDDQRAHAAVALLQKYCLSTDADPTTVNRRATEAGLAVVFDRSAIGAHHKLWRVGNAAGMFGLGTVSFSVPSRYMCSVTIPGRSTSAAAIESILTADPRLGTPVKRLNTPTKSAVVWVVNLGPRANPPEVILTPITGTISVMFGFPPS